MITQWKEIKGGTLNGVTDVSAYAIVAISGDGSLHGGAEFPENRREAVQMLRMLQYYAAEISRQLKHLEEATQ